VIRSLPGLCLILSLAAAGSALADTSHTVTLTTLDWPPYTGSQLPEQGLNSTVIRAAYAAMGYKVRIKVVPWQRAVAEASLNPQVAGYFPEYDSAAGRKSFFFSDPIGRSPLGFAERMNSHYQWQQLAELARLRIGVVQGYVNTAELDERIATKRQNADEALDDTQNLLKLDRRHIDLAVIDRYVFDYLIQNDPKLKTARSNLRMNPHLLEEKLLYVCFKPSAEGKRLADILNQGLKRINVEAITHRYLMDNKLDGVPPPQPKAAMKKPAG
jgi:polar amino acid transport system substrate-binding protein